jgi:hypothetical protein
VLSYGGARARIERCARAQSYPGLVPPVIRSWSFDLDTECAEVEYDDHRARFNVAFPVPADQAPPSIRQLRMDFAHGVLQLRLPNGTLAPIELAIPGYDNETLLRQRFVVYLDQNLWSRMARFRHGLESIPENEANAAAALSRLAEQQHIIMPMSASHFAETGRHQGPTRMPIASTILELSRGWQMRHPGRIGLYELTAAPEGCAPPKRDAIFTLAPHATFLLSPAIPHVRLLAAEKGMRAPGTGRQYPATGPLSRGLWPESQMLGAAPRCGDHFLAADTNTARYLADDPLRSAAGRERHSGQGSRRTSLRPDAQRSGADPVCDGAHPASLRSCP